MQSKLLIEYLRTGVIAPLEKGDGKDDVEAKLGLPAYWACRTRGFWQGPLLANPYDSWAWQYGSLCVCFPNVSGSRPGISLDYHDIKPVFFPPPFAELPQSQFTLGEVIELMRDAEIQFSDFRGVRHAEATLVSEGRVGVSTRAGNLSPKSNVIYLYPCKFEEEFVY